MNSQEKALVALVKAAGNSIHGRLKLQKLVYLFKELGYEFSEEYEYGNYGPFSRDLADEVSSLCFEDILQEQTLTTGDGYLYYEYTLKENSETTKIPAMAIRTEHKHLLEESGNNLEVLATARYILKSGVPLQDVAAKLHQLKPRFRIEEIKRIINNPVYSFLFNEN